MADGEVRFEASVETKKAMKNLASAEKSFASLGEKIDEINRKIRAFEDAQMNSTSKSSNAYRKLLQLQKELADAEQRRARIQDELSRKQSQLATYTKAFNERGAIIDVEKAERRGLQKKLDVLDPESAEDAEEYKAALERIKVLTRQIDEDSKMYVALEQQKNKAMKEEESIAKELAKSEEKVSTLRQKVSTQGSVSEKARVDDARQWAELQRQLNKLTEQYQAALQRVRDLEAQVSQSRRDDRSAAREEQREARLQALQKILTAVKNAYENLGRIAFKVAKSLTITPILNTFKKLHRSVTSFGKRLKFVLLQGLLFRNMRKYLSEFAQAMGSALNKNEQFNASLANLKGTFWAAIAPVVDAVAPILAKFLDMIAKLITYLSGLVGILFGIGKASKKAGAGLASAGEKGKEASNNLASWDTIQNLDSGSGGGSGSGISPTFGQDFDEAYAKLEKFRELFEKGDWFEIGKYVGEELSKVVTLIDNWITGTLAPNIIKWAKNIGSFINGFFVGMDWSNLGKTVGDAIVAVFDGISTFLATVDWEKVGQSVKEFLLGIDWGAVLKSVGRAIVNAIVAAMDFVQGLTGIDLTTFTDYFKEWLDLFSDIIDLLSGKMTFKEWFDQLSDDQLDIVYWASVIEVILAVIGVFKALSSVWTTLTQVVIPALSGALKFLAANPVVAIIAGILILIRVIIQVIKHWDEIKAVAENVINAIKEWVSQAVEDIRNWINGFIDGISTAIGGFIKAICDWIDKFVDDIVVWWKNLVEDTKKFIEQIKGIIETVKQKINSVIQDIIGFVKNLWNNLVNIFNNIKNKALDIVNTIKNAIRTAINFIIRILNGMISGVESAVNWIVSGLNRISFSIPSWVPGIGGKRFGFDLSSVYFGRIPELAQGAVVNPSHEFAAILGDNRQEQEIVSPLSTMKQALLDALSEYSGNTEVVLEVDGRKFATAMIPHINNRTRAYGTSVIL